MDASTILKREILLTIDDSDLEECEDTDKIYNRQVLLKSLEQNNSEYVEELWDNLNEEGLLDDCICKFRESGVKTGLLPRQFMRSYESEEVAVRITGSYAWIGWTYWYGF